MPSIYKNVSFSAILYVIDIFDQEQINMARKELHRLMNEDELRHVGCLALVFNVKLSKIKEEKGTSTKGGAKGGDGLGFDKEKRKKQLHDELDLEGSVNKRI